MKRFLVNHYDSTGSSNPSSEASFNALEKLVVRPLKLIRTQYEPYPAENIAYYYTTPTNTFLTLTGDIIVTEPGLYMFEVSSSSGVYDLFINDKLVCGSYTGGNTGSYYTKGGLLSLKLRFNGLSNGGNFGVGWKEPGQIDFSVIPSKYLPFFGLSLFPFEIYDGFDETMQQDYKIIGDLQQKQTKYTLSEPSKTFKITIRQDTVYDRLKLKAWFDSVKGKYKKFAFNSRKSEFNLAIPPTSGESSIVVRNAYSAMAYFYVKKILYFESIGFATQIRSVGQRYIPDIGMCDELFLEEPLPIIPKGSCSVNFLYFCRLDTDTLTFELEDINRSATRLTLKELYDDYYIESIMDRGINGFI